MCNKSNCSHDLDDNLDDLLGGFTRDASEAAEFAKAVLTANVTSARTFETKCAACEGTGRFYSYTGRLVGNCFKCEGSGVIRTKTDPKVFEANRAKAAEKRDEADQARRIAIRDFQHDDATAADWRWMAQSAERGFEFAQSMVDALLKYGRLTEKQHAAVIRLREREDQRNIDRAAERETRAANAPAINVAKLEQAFATARENGLKRPKVTLAGYKFKLAPETGRNAGALYVVRADDDQYLGKIANGKFIRVRDCSDAEELEIIAVASDPHSAAVAYGQRTGICACCGRELTNAESVALGIGPICRGKFGWA